MLLLSEKVKSAGGENIFMSSMTDSISFDFNASQLSLSLDTWAGLCCSHQATACKTREIAVGI